MNSFTSIAYNEGIKEFWKHLMQQTTYLAAMRFQDVPTCLKFGLRNLSRKYLVEQALDKVLWLVNLVALLLLLHIFLFMKS